MFLSIRVTQHPEGTSIKSHISLGFTSLRFYNGGQWENIFGSIHWQPIYFSCWKICEYKSHPWVHGKNSNVGRLSLM